MQCLQGLFQRPGGMGFIPAQNCTCRTVKNKAGDKLEKALESSTLSITQYLETTKLSLELLCFGAMWKFDKWYQWKEQERDSNQSLLKQGNCSGLESSSFPQFYSVPPFPPLPWVFWNFLHFFFVPRHHLLASFPPSFPDTRVYLLRWFLNNRVASMGLFWKYLSNVLKC